MTSLRPSLPCWKWLRATPEGDTIHLVMDNLSSHTCKGGRRTWGRGRRLAVESALTKDVYSQCDKHKWPGPAAPPINCAQNKRMVPEPSARETPQCNEHDVHN